MPWSPLLYEKQILDSILEEMTPIENTISSSNLFKIIMRETRMIGDKSISNTVRALETLGYIKRADDGVRFKVLLENIEIRLMKLGKQ